MMLSGRYLLVFMGVFAVYAGFLYNEFFGISMDLFGSSYEYPPFANIPGTPANFTNPDRPYPFGVDPAWKDAGNELDFYNSLKMKMSVLMGLVQMLFGIFLSLLNHIYFKKPENVIFEWIPQVVFICSIFGYMDVLIVYKWLRNWTTYPVNNPEWQGAPRILNLLISMFLNCFSFQGEYQMYDGQFAVQTVLLILAFISVPIMFLGKPIVLQLRHNRSQKQKQHGGSILHDEGEEEEEEFNAGELWIHQTIHTIEYVLGCISNTASYLRLWALSLAHTQLAEVFWQRVMLLCYEVGGPLVVFGGWAVWAALTIGILLIMESLSAFLHALRLHWVEFQNKFFMGDGYKFVPFSYKLIEENAINQVP